MQGMQRQSVLVSWIGGNDLTSESEGRDGPVLATLKANHFDAVELLYNYPEKKVKPYLDSLKKQVKWQRAAQPPQT